MSETREKLEASAQRSVQQGGLNAISFRSLADEIGIKSSSVHYYFPEKSDLARALIERYHQEFNEKLKQIGSSNGNLRKKLKAFIGIFESVASNDCLCLCGMLASEVDSLSEENRDLLNQYFTDTESWLSNQFNLHEDEMATPLKTTELSAAVLSGLEGALLLDRTAKNNKNLRAHKKLILSALI